MKLIGALFALTAMLVGGASTGGGEMVSMFYLIPHSKPRKMAICFAEKLKWC